MTIETDDFLLQLAELQKQLEDVGDNSLFQQVHKVRIPREHKSALWMYYWIVREDIGLIASEANLGSIGEKKLSNWEGQLTVLCIAHEALMSHSEASEDVIRELLYFVHSSVMQLRDIIDNE